MKGPVNHERSRDENCLKRCLAKTELLPPDLVCRFVIAQRNEPGVPQVVLARPLQELDLGRPLLASGMFTNGQSLSSNPPNFLNGCPRTIGVKPFRVRAA